MQNQLVVDDLKEHGVDIYQALVRDTTKNYSMTRTGALHQSVRLAKVENARHPSKLVANAVSEAQEGYISYVKDAVGRGVLLGLQAGLVQTGSERGLERWVV